MLDDIVSCINGEFRSEMKGSVLEQQGDPIQNGMLTVQKIQHVQSLVVKVINIDKAVCVFLTRPFASHFVNFGAVEALPVIVVRVSDIDIRRLNNMIRPVQKLNRTHNAFSYIIAML